MANKDAIAFLKDQHREAEKLFKEFEKAKGEKRKKELANEICLALSVHFGLEEQIFYPACEGIVEENDLKEGYVEHDAAKLLVAEIEANETGDDSFFDTKVHVLQEEIEHHVKEEEEPGGIFAQARKGGLDTEAIGERLAERSKDLTERYKKDGPPTPSLKTMDEVSV
jgi:hypothetical protein